MSRLVVLSFLLDGPVVALLNRLGATVLTSLADRAAARLQHPRRAAERATRRCFVGRVVPRVDRGAHEAVAARVARLFGGERGSRRATWSASTPAWIPPAPVATGGLERAARQSAPAASTLACPPWGAWRSCLGRPSAFSVLEQPGGRGSAIAGRIFLSCPLWRAAGHAAVGRLLAGSPHRLARRATVPALEPGPRGARIHHGLSEVSPLA